MRTVGESMTREVVTVRPDAPFKQVVRHLVEGGVHALPVVDERGVLRGVVSSSDLTCHEERTPSLTSLLVGGRTARASARKARGRTAADLMSSPARTASPEDAVDAALERMRRARVGRLVVVDEGRVVGILSRSDLLRAFLRSDADLARDVGAAVRAAVGRRHEVQVDVVDGVVRLGGRVELASAACTVGAAARAVPGVVDVDNAVVSQVDDLVALAGMPGV